MSRTNRFFQKLQEFDGYDSIGGPTWQVCVIDIDHILFVREKRLKDGSPVIHIHLRHTEVIVAKGTIDQLIESIHNALTNPGSGPREI